ncbi:MAG TPA: hypothetical protein VF517_10450 [Thermoleophilaceae bacterium]|jgi:hypothetical protein
MERFGPLAGLIFLVLAIVSFAIAGDPTDLDKSTEEYARYWADNDTEQVISAIIGCYAAVAFLWFSGSVREVVAGVEPGKARLASIAQAGAAVFSAGLLVNSAIQFAAAQTAEDVSPQATEALGALYENFFFPMAGGMAVFLLAAGIGAVRHGAFDRRLGWMAVVIAVVALTPAGFFGFIASMIWVGLASIVLYRKKDPLGSGAAQPPAPA